LSGSANVGVLYLVGTPIGNLEDISYRSVRILREADLVACEDTRHTGLLLKHYGISARLDSYHDFNKEKKGPALIQWLLSGRSVAVVTDAGTPGISDPAFNLVRDAAERGIPVVPVPGACAAIAALTVSGLPTDRFLFEGFLPAKKGRASRLEALASETRTLVFYESPHRLLRTLEDLKRTLGNRRAAVCRELTKKFEEVLRGTLEELTTAFSNRAVQGEFVLVVHGLNPKERSK
jgi:16S rRNA (cytidine1402-2'-O)-methyltransferase